MNFVSRISSQFFLALLLIAAALLSFSCGSEFDANEEPGGGQVSVNGSAFQPIIFQNVTLNVDSQNATIKLSSSFSGQGGNFQNITITLVLPATKTQQLLDLSTTKSAWLETTNNSTGGLVSTQFTSTSVKGSAFLNDLTTVTVIGSFEGVFKDKTGKTRQITNGTFLLNKKS